MESEGSPSTQNSGRGANPHASTNEFQGPRPPIPPPPFFHGFGGAGNPMPFLYPHAFIPPIPGFGFGSPPQGSPSTTTNLTEESKKRALKESVIDLSTPPKKKRAPRKKPVIVDLDDNKCDSDPFKNSCHWKDHWVIQLITLRGEMQNTFSAPPKQGVFHILFPLTFSLKVDLGFVIFFLHIACDQILVFKPLYFRCEHLHIIVCPPAPVNPSLHTAAGLQPAAAEQAAFWNSGSVCRQIWNRELCNRVQSAAD